MIITQAFHFEAAHRLPAVPPGHRCYALHGHSYRVELRLEGPVDAQSGWVVDFFAIESAFTPLLAVLDHGYLNDVDGLANPTAENIAIWIWRRMQPQMPLLAAVLVFETPQCWAEYRGD